MDGRFYKVICENTDIFGKEIYEDVNRSTMDEVFDFINRHRHDNGTWIIIPMECLLAKTER